MFHLKHTLCTPFFVIAIVVGLFFSSHQPTVDAATRSPTITPSRTSTLSRTITPSPLATNTPTVTTKLKGTSESLSASLEATVQAYLAQTNSLTGTVAISTTPTTTVAKPVRLVIPKLKIDAVIESVGQDGRGAMASPSRVEKVAWYSLGASPGQIGNAVIAGHFDLANGKPAVFWSIGKLKPGDEVIVYDAAKIEYHFAVTGNQRYAYAKAPIESIFGFALHSQLNLITCAGKWDRKSRNYSNRVVVFTELIKTVRSEG